ncbi:MAG: polyprenyl diphosphate synthase [Armatimonadota bacterium]|nr:polyprenyl diphosphate synthase [Armatimonadota bacterium]
MTTLAERSAPPANDLEALKARLDPARLPAHVAIIMDGNGRWARQHHLPSRLLGHREGYKTVRHIVRDAAELDIKVLTLYVFSNENWRRPKHETDGLMNLIEHAARTELRELHENGVRIRFVGRREGLSASLLREMDRDMEVTQHNSRITLNLAINYGGRAEIADAARKLVEAVQNGEIDAAQITEDHLAARMYAPDLPDPDLLIRTAGELRISNFLLWGVAYAEMWVTPTLWPDFTTAHLVDALEDYQKRVRKFGAVVNA